MIFKNRLCLSAMAGIVDAEFAKKHNVALAILGSFNADEKAMLAGIEVTKRGRREFIYSNPIKGIEEQLKKMEDFDGKVAINVRSGDYEGYTRVAKLCSEYQYFLEINAHCRQPEFLSIGVGQSLLYNQDKLLKIVNNVTKYSDVIVKIRGGLEVKYEDLAKRLFEAGVFALHVDAMILGGGCDYNLIRKLSTYGNIIGNNSVVDVKSARKVIESGAILVSSARAVLKNERFFDSLLKDGLLSSQIEVK